MKVSVKLAVIAALLGSIMLACASDPNIESAKLNLRNADFQGVIASAEAALEENPENADAFYYKGAAWLEIAEEQPVDQRRDALQNARTNMLRADELFTEQEISSNESQTAIPLLVNRWRDEYSQGISGIDFEGENPPEVLQLAIQHVYNAHTVMPDSTMNLDALSELYFMSNDVDNAAKYMREAIDQAAEPDLSRYQRLTYFFMLQENNEGTLEILEVAAEVFPDEIFFVQEQANIFFRMGETEQAMAVLEDLIARDESNAQYRLVFGSQIYQEYLNLTQDVAAMYDELFDLNQEFRELARQSNPSAAAVRDVESRIDAVQDQIRAMDERRFAIADRAEEQLMIAFELEPNEPNTTYTLGAINENRGLALVDQINNLFDDDMDFSEMEQQAMDFFRASLPFYEKTAELEPEETDNWMKLFQLYTRLGMQEEAERAAERAGF
ncbi:hypothetical protein CYPRO_0886 [Cyclonatronum proteinivorum]|uniref:Tetratricopeptide repeat-containing protein n=1 Tax=Cyclonatronum proteinivorum TaxID=1457365 RepID=A0A345UI61_9BACT|nr:hypothetical protein [Cyclonatronum proteinivorum]AXJ00163.1 hypothetical protein CYPRO_0886 [Cyclonatronum proteinivorum]